ncbi:hypothetical protein [Thiomonas sp.]
MENFEVKYRIGSEIKSTAITASDESLPVTPSVPRIRAYQLTT